MRDAAEAAGANESSVASTRKAVLAGRHSSTPSQRADAARQAAALHAAAARPSTPAPAPPRPPLPPEPAPPPEHSPPPVAVAAPDPGDPVAYWTHELTARRADLEAARAANQRTILASLASSADKALVELGLAREAARDGERERGIRDQRDPAIILELVAQFAAPLSAIAPEQAALARDALAAALSPHQVAEA